jgi:hypothetical protein
MPDEAPDFVEVEIEAEPVFADCLKDARELEPGDDKGVAALMAKAALARLSDVPVEMLLKAVREATGVSLKTLRLAWQGAQAETKKKVWEANALERAARAAEAEAERQRQAEKEHERIWASCRHIAESPTLLAEMEAVAHQLGLVGESAGVRGVYLTYVSRLLAGNAVRLLRLGSTASGKNYPIEVTLPLVPEAAVVQISGASPKALPYFGGDDPDWFKHKIIYIPEAVILANRQRDIENEFTAMFRTLISEGRLVYSTVVIDAQGKRETVTITKNGPIAAILTTARDVDREMKTRALVQETDETGAQTHAIVKNVLLGRQAAPDLQPWLDLQRWLEGGAPYRVDIPFRRAIAEAFDEWRPDFLEAAAMRMRRDITSFLVAIEASAVLHRAKRKTIDDVVIASLDDYRHAYEAFGEGLAAVHGKASEKVIATVEAIENMGGAADLAVKVTLRELARRLRVGSPMTASARLAAALDYGALEQDDKLSGHGGARYFRVVMTAEEIRAEPGLGVFPPPEVVARVFLPASYPSEDGGQTGQMDRKAWL